jgi:hypothetical protein
MLTVTIKRNRVAPRGTGPAGGSITGTTRCLDDHARLLTSDSPSQGGEEQVQIVGSVSRSDMFSTGQPSAITRKHPSVPWVIAFVGPRPSGSRFGDDGYPKVLLDGAGPLGPDLAIHVLLGPLRPGHHFTPAKAIFQTIEACRISRHIASLIPRRISQRFAG